MTRHALALGLLVVLSAAMLGCSNSATVGTDTGSRSKVDHETKAAYIKLAKHLADSHLTDPDKPEPKHDTPKIIADTRAMILDIKSLKYNDPDLKAIGDEAVTAASELLDSMQAIQRIPKPPGELEQFLTGFGYGFTFQFDAAANYDREVRQQNNAIQAEFRGFMTALDRAQATTHLLPRVAKKIAGPSAKKGTPLRIDIDETWGFTGPDCITLVNASGQTLHNSTVVVTLNGKDGETKENVHFVETWAPGSVIYAKYDPGTVVLDQRVGRKTVLGIQNAKVSLYCDELNQENIEYQYYGAERDKDIGGYLDKIFKPKAVYRAFSRGLVWDDQRAVKLHFDGLMGLTKGTIIVTLKNGRSSANKVVAFERWRANENKTVEFPDVNWDPNEWDITFRFDDTPVTRMYTWKR